MKTFLALILLASTALAAGSNVSRGDLLKNRQYQTNANIQLYVDPTGADTNACTSTGTAACLTIQGAVNKVPKLLRHRVTISIAAGSYAGATISGFTIDPSLQKSTAGILIEGVLTNVVPTTGSATGTATAGSAGSGSTFGTLTNSGEAWTVDDTPMISKFLVINGGTGVGQIKPIVTNTSTVLTIAGLWTAPTGTSTYAIQSNAASITSPAALIPDAVGGTVIPAAGLQFVNNNTGPVGITVRNLDISPGVGVTAIISAQHGALFLAQITSVNQLVNQMTDNGGAVTMTSCSSIAPASTIVVLSVGAPFVVTASYFKSPPVGQAPVIQITGGSGSVTGSYLHGMYGLAALAATFGSSVFGGGWPSGIVSGVRCDCASAAASACVAVGTKITGTASQVSGYGMATISSSINVTNCGHGIFNNGGIITLQAVTLLSGNALSNGAENRNGGFISMSNQVHTLTGGVAEMSLDGNAITATWASIAAAGFNCLTNVATGSRFCRL